MVLVTVAMTARTVTLLAPVSPVVYIHRSGGSPLTVISLPAVSSPDFGRSGWRI